MVFLFQLICGVFAFTLTPFEVGSNFRKILFSAFAILVFMFLLYGEFWKVGANDATKSDCGSLHRGILVGLCGTTLNWLIAVFMLLWQLNPKMPDFLIKFFTVVNMVYNGLYLGIFNIEMTAVENGPVLADGNVWIYFLTAVPALFVCWLGYYLGRREKHLTKLFIPETPEEKELKAEKKKSRKGEPEE